VRRSLRLVAGLALMAALVSGCSSTQQANETLPSAAPTSSSPEFEPLGPSDLPMPAEARERTADGFNAFVGYYIELINRLDEDLDARYLRQFSRGCDTCERLAADAENDARQGYSYDGGTITITAQAPANLTNEGAETAFTVEQAGYTVLDSNGSPVPGLSGEPVGGLAAGMAGLWVEDHWVATNLTFG
jgi:hypothetical protein